MSRVQHSPQYLQMTSFRRLVIGLIVFSLVVSSTVDAEVNQDSADTEDNAPDTVSNLSTINATSSDQVRKQYWKRTFDEIRNLRTKSQSTSSAGGMLTNQWKLFREKGSYKKRFEGFVSWERLLQDWADEIQEYMAQETEEDYPLGSYGVPSSTSVLVEGETAGSVTGDKEKMESTTVDDHQTTMSKQKQIILPSPKPAKKGEAVLPHTDVADKSKRIWIVTTAALPWMTGTAVNPLLRAAYLSHGRKEAGGSVTLHLPWLEREKDQETVYGPNNMFSNQQEQEEYVRNWLRESAGLPVAAEELRIEWYTAWQNKVENSIYSMGDIIALIPDDEVDICILEEPEHLNWYRAPGESWTKKFKHVVGILHTNYFQYALDQPAAIVRAPAMRLLCSWMCRAHCHRIVKLSGTLEQVAPEKELVENVHGVRGNFIETGVELRSRLGKSLEESDPVFGATADPKIYFIGKLLWSKGLGSLMELLKFAEETADLRVKVDMYGGGPDKAAAEAKALKLGLDMPFHGPLDHSKIALSHKIFVNPSTSEVLCTTSAEALAMGKFVVLPSHPSNDFFAQFPNCLAYTTQEEFVANLYYAITHEPEPLSEEYAHALSWEAATERLAASACISLEENERMEEALATDRAAVEISLPPLIEDAEGRQIIAATLNRSRERYRQFRERLSNEISHNKVLPRPVRERLVAELGKRLDFDIDEVLASPKLRLQLSPAELDKSVLELYEVVIDGPGGDLLRLIGGGGAIALQNLYLRRKNEKERLKNSWLPDVFPSLVDDDDSDDQREGRYAIQRIRWAMRKNIPKGNKVGNSFVPSQSKGKQVSQKSDGGGQLKMSAACYPTTFSSPVRRPIGRGRMTMSLLI